MLNYQRVCDCPTLFPHIANISRHLFSSIVWAAEVARWDSLTRSLGINAAQASRILDRFGANDVLSHLEESAGACRCGIRREPCNSAWKLWWQESIWTYLDHHSDLAPNFLVGLVILYPIIPSLKFLPHDRLGGRQDLHILAHYPMQLTNLKSWSQSPDSRGPMFLLFRVKNQLPKYIYIYVYRYRYRYR